MSKDVYESPLSSRYASPYMLHLFSADMRFQTWRRLWTALARAEHELGLPITAGQVAELEAHITDIDYAVAEQREREGRHDVMAHVYAYGKAAPSAAVRSAKPYFEIIIMSAAAQQTIMCVRTPASLNRLLRSKPMQAPQKQATSMRMKKSIF